MPHGAQRYNRRIAASPTETKNEPISAEFKACATLRSP